MKPTEETDTQDTSERPFAATAGSLPHRIKYHLDCIEATLASYNRVAVTKDELIECFTRCKTALAAAQREL